MRSAHRVVLLFALLVTSWTTSSWACSRVLIAPVTVVAEAAPGGIWWGPNFSARLEVGDAVVLAAADGGDDVETEVVHVGPRSSLGIRVPDVDVGRRFQTPGGDQWLGPGGFVDVLSVVEEVDEQVQPFPEGVVVQSRFSDVGPPVSVGSDCSEFVRFWEGTTVMTTMTIDVPDGFAVDVSSTDGDGEDIVWIDNENRGGKAGGFVPSWAGDAPVAGVSLRRLADGEVEFIGAYPLLPGVELSGCTCTSSSSTRWGLACLPLLLAGFAARRRRPQRASSSAAVAAVMLLVTSWTTSSWACSVNREPNSVTVFDAPRGGLWWGRDLDPPPVGTVVRLTALDDGDDLDVTVVHQGHVSSIGLQVPDDIEVGRRFALPDIFFYEDADNPDLALTVVDTAPDDDGPVPPAGVSFESVAETPSWSIRANCGDVGPWYSNGFQAHDVVVTAPAGHVVDLMYGFVDDVDTVEDERFAFNTRNQWLYVIDGGAGVVRHRMRSLNDEFDVLHVRLRRLATGALGPVTTVSLLPHTHYGCTCTSSASTPWATMLLTLSTLFVACRRGRRKRRHRRG